MPPWCMPCTVGLPSCLLVLAKALAPPSELMACMLVTGQAPWAGVTCNSSGVVAVELCKGDLAHGAAGSLSESIGAPRAVCWVRSPAANAVTPGPWRLSSHAACRQSTNCDGCVFPPLTMHGTLSHLGKHVNHHVQAGRSGIECCVNLLRSGRDPVCLGMRRALAAPRQAVCTLRY
jgi:hypothetical protein